MAEELIGRSFGPYQPLELIGSGGMASVYRAYDPAEQRYVALKILPAHLSNNEVFRTRFFREAKVIAHLQHPNILPIYDFGKSGDMLYFVLKLAEGGSLAEMIQGHFPLEYRFIARVIGQIGGALDYAHGLGIIHRDLKPENILLDANKTAYLADFGIAHTDDDTTTSGTFLGTTVYASPEQCQGETLTPTSDVYSLGAVLYEMLTGQPPYDGPTPIAIMHMHVNEPIPNPLRLRPELPNGVSEVIRKALAKPPQVRYQSAGALSGALNESLRRELGSTKQLGESAAPPPRSAKSPIQPIQAIRRDTPPPRPTRKIRTPTHVHHHWPIMVLWGIAAVILAFVILLMIFAH